MKKVLAILIIFLSSTLPSQAVLKEQNLGATLSVLKSELVSFHEELIQRMQLFDLMNKQFQSQMINTMKKSDQIALMLYSQKPDYVFDLTYACNEATSLYNDFVTNRMPFERFVEKANNSIYRYNQMKATLQRMPDMVLDNAQQRADRRACLIYAADIEKELTIQRDKIKDTQRRYEMVASHLKVLNNYAIKAYEDIRKNVFINGDRPYYKLLENIAIHWKQSKEDVREKYAPQRGSRSEWRGPLIGMLGAFVLFYIIIVGSLNIAVIKWALPKRLETPEFKKKRPCVIIASTVITFAIVLMILSSMVLRHNFFILASELLAQYSWLIGAISLSLIIRLEGDKVMKGMRSYVPIIFVGFVVFGFRITFMPSTIVNLTFPIILLLGTLWQANVVYRYNKEIPLSDRIYTWVSFLTMAVSCVISWVGYTLMSVQILIWWIIQLTAVQTITCVYDLLLAYQKKRIPKDADIRRTWFYCAIYKMLVPILGVYSVAGSIYWAATVFDLTEWCVFFFTVKFVDIPGIIQISLTRLSMVLSLWFIFRYILFLQKEFYVLFKTKTKSSKTGSGAVALSINIIRYIGWGIYLFIAMVILDVNRSGITLILTGLSTGIGFAMKDTLENLFYGISLMAGRVKIGDVIECDGVRGKVTNINYQSTMVETIDGSVMAFLNSQLFSKNFKNMTKNRDNELVKIGVGISYGANIEHVRELIISRVKSLDCYQHEKGVSVLFDNFGDSSVDLSVVVWVPVHHKPQSVSRIKEEIYNVLNENHIEIPFPQQDIYIHGLEKRQ